MSYKPAYHRVLATAAAATVFSALVSGCGILDPKPAFEAAPAVGVVPRGFLRTEYEPLNTWLETPLSVLLHDVPLRDVFNSRPLQPLNYQIISLPVTSRLVNVDSVGMTRRQLLWSIAHEHGLLMTPRYYGESRPSYIEIQMKAEID